MTNDTAHRQLNGAVIRETMTIYYEEKMETILFCGLIQQAEYVTEGGIYRFKIELISASSLMYCKRKSRNYQQVDQTYEEIVKEIVSDYKNGATICSVGETEVGISLM